MSINQNLFFVNNSGSGGKVCIYQIGSNATFPGGVDVLAWLLAGANQFTTIRFRWTTDYNFAWFDDDPPKSSQIIPASLNNASTVRFSKNQYGYYFQAPAKTAASSLQIQADGTIPASNKTLAGFGMGGAGTFAAPAMPNVRYVFTPVADADLAYGISFGAYAFEVGDPIDVDTLNNPGTVSFPIGVDTMTATLNSANAWTFTVGAPRTTLAALDVVLYEAGKGIVAP